MPASAGILTAEFKVNLLAAGAGDRLVATARVIRPGRTLVVTQAEVHAEQGGERKLVALMTATLMAVEGREDVAD
jgi:acyl-coenzyme A thioesterase PaaI-like protein